jgi:hypothetical protein
MSKVPVIVDRIIADNKEAFVMTSPNPAWPKIAIADTLTQAFKKAEQILGKGNFYIIE